jgi:hypothetical protein
MHWYQDLLTGGYVARISRPSDPFNPAVSIPLVALKSLPKKPFNFKPATLLRYSKPVWNCFVKPPSSKITVCQEDEILISRRFCKKKKKRPHAHLRETPSTARPPPPLVLILVPSCRMDLPGPTTSVGTRTNYSVGTWDYLTCAARYLMAWSTRTTEEKYSVRKLYMSRTV